MTETLNSLSMITKAVVPNSKIFVSAASYGRSFKMTTAGCWTEEYTYTGPDSGAFAGMCTNTAGILANYEIELIIAENPSAQVYWDSTAQTNILVYNDTKWVSYMDDTNKASWTTFYTDLNFLGTVDWAVDY